MTPNQLRRRLTRLRDSTASAEELPAPGWWVGDKAGERRVLDDLMAGRVSWQAANENAREGLVALKKGNREIAELCLWAATDHYVAALELRLKKIRPSDMPKLTAPAKRRGRPPKNK
jgi:hypothetical protein